MSRFRERVVHFDRSSSWTEGSLRDLWNSMYSPGTFHGLNEKSAEIQGIAMLLETALSSVKKLYIHSETSEAELNKSIQVKDQEIAELKENIRSLKTTCSNCSSLKRELNDSRKKVRDVENRMSSIAKILNLGGDKHSSDSENFSNAANLVSQMLYPGTPKRKKRPKDENSPVAGDESILAGPTPHQTEPEAPIDGKGYIPETEATPKKTAAVPESPEGWRTKKRKVLSSSLNNEAGRRTTPRKNLSADSYLGKGSETPEKRIQFNLNINCFSDEPEKETQPTVGPVEEKLNNSELERIWFGGEKKQNVEIDKNAKGISWKLKEAPSQSFVPSAKKGAKNLKQLKLGVVKSSKQVDITQMEGFGDPLPSKESSTDNDDEIIKPSPKRKRKGRKRLDNAHSFAPLATSTQIPRQLEDSFDKIPEKITKSPKYKYKGSPVRKKDERLRLEGGECKDCEEYFKVVGKGMDPEALRARKNACSKHREKFQRSKTPPGFWDPNIPDTPECRAKGLYTSVYRLKDDV